MEKVCCLCGADVSQVKRVKDNKGHYYCATCHAKALQRAAQAQGGPVQGGSKGKEGGGGMKTGERAVRGGNANGMPRPQPQGDGDLLELSPVSKPATTDELDIAPAAAPPASGPMMGCSGCKQLVPEAQVRNVDGEFLCTRCLTQRNRSEESRKQKEQEAGRPGKVQPFLSTAPGGLVMIVLASVGMWLLFMGTLKMFPATQDKMGLVLASIVYTVAGVVKAGFLIVSMLIVSKIFGGVEFGNLATAVGKAMALVGVESVWSMGIAENETLQMLDFGFHPGLLLLGFVLLFRLDFMEAVVLSVVNWMISWVMKIVVVMLVMEIILRGASLMEEKETGTVHGTGVVAPADEQEEEEQGAAPPAQRETAPDGANQQGQTP